MDCAEQFASEWQRLKEMREQLVRETDRLAKKRASLSQEPEMLKLLQEKRELKKEVPDLNLDVRVHSCDIEGRRNNLEKRRRATTDERVQRELATKLKNHRNRLARLEELKVPEVILEKGRRLIFEVEGPIEDVETLYRQMDVESWQKQQQAQLTLEETLERISTIDGHYRSTKHCFEEAIREIQRMIEEHHAKEIEWATRSRGHLEWMLEHEPSRKDDIVRRYMTRFPADTLVDLFPPPPTPALTPQKPGGKKRHARPDVSPPLVAKKPGADLSPWRFWVTFNANDEGQELSQEKEQFLADLRTAFEAVACSTSLVALVYDKLMAVAGMEVPQRQTIKKLAYGERLTGWKIIRVSRQYRLFLSVDEERRYIRFLPCQRKKAYSGH